MKTMLVSTNALYSSLRMTTQKAQNELVNQQTAMITGRHADVGLALGGQTAQTVTLARDMDQLKSILDTNALAEQRLTNSQSALSQMSGSAQDILNAMIASSTTDDINQIQVAQTAARQALVAFTAAVNTPANGEYLFGGINTDTKPVEDYFDPAGSPAKAAFDATFQSYFGFTQNDSQTETITAAQMDDFLTNHVEPLFDETNWQANWSSASSTSMTSRIGKSEVIETSTSANSKGMRDLAMAAVIAVELLDKGLTSDVRNIVNTRATSTVGSALTGIDAERSNLGVSESRVKKANESISLQINIVETHINKLEGVDPYEASTRISSLLTQIETSYSLTARIQQLTLMNYL